MTRVPLLAGAYQSRALIASAQRCINLYPESNQSDPQAPVPITHYPTPGLVLQDTTLNNAPIRGMYRTSLGTAYVISGPNVYFMPDVVTLIQVGAIADNPSQVYMADNGQVAVLVDGTTTGYAIDLTSNNFGTIIDPSFYGADFVLFLDTFFVFNRPNTNQFYISLSQVSYALLTTGTSFDPLDIAAKAGSGDPIVSISTVHDELWLEGALTTEVWSGTGAADFFFQRQQGAFIDHGSAAKYSIACQDIYNFWLMQDRQGDAIIVQGANYQVSEISTPAIVADLKKYATISDAIGYCYQQQDHAFYIITFPTANKTWAYELNTKQWHELAWLDANGGLNRHRANCCMFAFGLNMVGDWQNGSIYSLDPHVFTDNGNPIPRIRTFPHMIQDGKRVSYKQFIIDLQVGTLDPSDPDNPPLVSLRWSDDRGATYGNPVIQTMGNGGDYLTQISYWKLGMARDRVFEVSWSSPINTALNGAFVEIAKVAMS
jgi:hypothetical protein